jgi:hypothetical protein
MGSRRLIPVALVLSSMLIGGCLSVPATKSEPPVTKADERIARKIGNDSDPAPRLDAFLKGEGLSTGTAEPGQAARLTAVWNHKIIYAPDPTHGGEPVPGFLGRVWVFGPELKDPLEPDGELFVAMWDHSPRADGTPPPLLEVWHIDRDTAATFRRPDTVGSGYTVFLPSQKYHVDLKHVNILCRYNGADGRNLVAAPQLLALDHSATLQRAAEKLGLKVGESPDGPGLLPKLPEPRTWPEKK